MANELGGIKVTLKAGVDSSGVTTGYAKIAEQAKKVEKQFQSTESSIKRVSDSTSTLVNKSGGASSAFKMQKNSLSQLSYQLQDVAVMAQYGADKFVILGTQGSQIASLFGPGGAVFGSILAVAALIGGTLVKSITAAKDATKELPSELTKRLAEIKAKFEEVDEASRNAFTGVEINKINTEYNKLADSVQGAQKEIDRLSGKTDRISVSRIQTMQGIIAKANGEMKDLALLMEKVGNMSLGAIEFEGIDTSGESSGAIQQRLDAIQGGIVKEREMISAWHQTRKAMKDKAISEEMGAAIMADIAERQRLDSAFDATKQRLEEERELLLENQSLTAEERAAKQKEIDDAMVAAKVLNDELIEQQSLSHQDRLTEIEKNASDKRIKLAQLENRAKLAALGGAFSDLSSLMNVENRKMFEIGKKAALSSAAITGVQAAMDAWRSGMETSGPWAPVVAAAYTAASLAKTGAMMAQIKSQSYGSAGSTTSFSGGVPAVNTAQQSAPPPQEVQISVTGRGGGIVDMLNFEVSNGAQLNLGG